MQTKDHYLLGKYLLSNSQELLASTKDNIMFKKAFLWGCVEPDYNLISYFRGTIDKKALAGHNFENASSYMKKMQKRLIEKSEWATREYFILGRYIHYVCDSFTYAHNEAFEGNLKEHCDYEEKLHKEFMRYLACNQPKKQKTFGLRNKIKIFGKVAEKLHEEYIYICGRPIIDCRYIFLTAGCL